jgi:hypothetical protein
MRRAVRALAVACAGVVLAAAAARGAAEPWLLDAPGLRVLAPADLAERPARFPFPVGERLEYAVTWLGIPAGTATVEVARFVALGTRRYAHVVATARTHPVFSLFYAVDDRSEAWIDLDAFRTERTRAVQRRGDRRWDERVVYDWSTHLLHAQLDKLHRGLRREIVFDLGPFAYDTSDLVYVLRALPIAPGYRIGVPTYANGKVFEFRIDVGAARSMQSGPFGRVDALAVRPSTRLDGGAYAAGSGTLWVAGDARVPLRLDGWIRTTQGGFRVGGLRATLVRYVASAPGWPPVRLPVDTPRAAIPDTADGVPQWRPPDAVRAARTAAGLAPSDTGFTLPLMAEASPRRAAGASTSGDMLDRP